MLEQKIYADHACDSSVEKQLRKMPPTCGEKTHVAKTIKSTVSVKTFLHAPLPAISPLISTPIPVHAEVEGGVGEGFVEG